MFELINDFENYDSCKKINDREIEINKTRKFKRKKNNSQFILYFTPKCSFDKDLFLSKQSFTIIKYLPLDKVLFELKKSLKTKDLLEHQFKLDITRSNIWINGNYTNNFQKIENYLNYTYARSSMERLMLLTTQSIFAFLIEWLSINLPYDFYIGELDHDEKNYKNSKIKIKIDKKTIKITKILRIFILTNSESRTYRYFLVKIGIDDFDNSDSLEYEVKFKKIKIKHINNNIN